MDENIIKEINVEHEGEAYTFLLSATAENIETSDERQFISKAKLDELNKKPGPNSAVSNNTVAFTTAAARVNLASGDTLNILIGKISKWLADLGTAAFKGVSESITETSKDYVAGIGVVKKVNDRITTQIKDGIITYEGGNYYIQWGADTVSKKKLGSGTIRRISLGGVTGDTTIDVKPHYADWRDLTLENFALDGCHGEKDGAQGENNWSGSYLEKSWNVSNGILTITKHIIGEPPYPLTVKSTVILFVSE